MKFKTECYVTVSELTEPQADRIEMALENKYEFEGHETDFVNDEPQVEITFICEYIDRDRLIADIIKAALELRE